MLKEAMLYERMEGKEDNRVHCFLCNHHCKISDSKFGICRVRQNRNGTLYTHVYGETIAANVDPIEKKPLYHFLPGSNSFSIATKGCNFQCGFCQNWQISQASKDGSNLGGSPLAPSEIVDLARKERCRSIAYTYTEPTIYFEYAYETAIQAHEASIYNIFVTNGFMTKEAIKIIRPYLDAANVDLKSFRDEFYRKTCHGRLQPVLDTISLMRELGIWVEVTTLVVPGQNDDLAELQDIAEFIAGVDTDIPWHISRFHPDYKTTESIPTPVQTLEKARSLGREAGLKYIYVGNVPGEENNTACPKCGEILIMRDYSANQVRVTDNSGCPSCGEHIAGVFK
ncbi:AmmeMemoRadiSam system radical SAM enzyme [Desulfopila inferna]|uniref:AmmeMemoRadiSam system radical SAM enzyme n=1 Tax=Desulfopila inferna TaxID=468528 RepID=UPI001F068D8C|nr:AmmeMemoRadiSam system radical SAM enzyme [Desulfopila inferna]